MMIAVSLEMTIAIGLEQPGSQAANEIYWEIHIKNLLIFDAESPTIEPGTGDKIWMYLPPAS